MEPLFLGLRHVALNVRDVQKSVEFYSKILGMQLEWMPDEDNAYLTSGGQDNLALHKSPAGPETAEGRVQILHHIGFVVRRPEDVDDWVDRVRQHGVTIAQPARTHRDGARSFYFYDPDGVLIQLLYHPPISDR
jgi:catechol 2,3-dioxygenase-like lactoylglutathione lyase family enzyme